MNEMISSSGTRTAIVIYGQRRNFRNRILFPRTTERKAAIQKRIFQFDKLIQLEMSKQVRQPVAVDSALD